MAGKIFVNYRRGDDPGFAQALFARLEQTFRSEQLFMDIDSLKPGVNFVQELEKQVNESDVMLSVIGRGWLDARDAAGARRLDNPHDYVRAEIKLALETGKRVIPVLVGEAQMPGEDQLPEDIKPLATRHAVRLSHAQFRHEAEYLFEVLKEALEKAEIQRRAQANKKREELGKGERKVSLDAAELMAVEHWEFVKASKKPEDYEKFIRDFPKSSLAPLAQRQLDNMATEAWRNRLDEIPSLEAFVSQFPYDAHVEEAKERIQVLRARADEAASWEQIKVNSDIEAVERHIALFPGGANARAARERLEQLKRERDARKHWLAIAGAIEPRPFEEFIELYPDTAYAAQARVRLEEIRRAREEAEWNAIRDERHATPFLRFLNAHRNGVHAAEAYQRIAALPQLVEQEAWAEVSGSDAALTLQAFLAAFPEGRNAKAARARLRALTGGQRLPPPPPPLTVSASSTTALSAPATHNRARRVIFLAFEAIIALIVGGISISVLSSALSYSGHYDVAFATTWAAVCLGLGATVLRLFGPRIYPAALGSAHSSRLLFHAIGSAGVLGWMSLLQAAGESNHRVFSSQDNVQMSASGVNPVLLVIVLLTVVASMKWPKLHYLYYVMVGVIGFFSMVSYASYFSFGYVRNYWITTGIEVCGGAVLLLLGAGGLLLELGGLLGRRKSLPQRAD